MVFHRNVKMFTLPPRAARLRRVLAGVVATAVVAAPPAPAFAGEGEGEAVLGQVPPEVLAPEIAEEEPTIAILEEVLPALDGPDAEIGVAARGLSLPDNLSTGSVVADAGMFRAMGLRAPPPRPQGGNAPYVLPVRRSLVSAAELGAPHHDYPAWDLALPIGTEIFSVTAGYVTKATSGGRCGMGVEVAGYDGFTYLYCHGSALEAYAGQSVGPGDLIMRSGNSGNSTGPHLHLQITSPGGALVCPQAPLLSWYGGGDISPAGASSLGCWYETHDEAKKKRKKKQKKRGRAPAGTSSPEPAPGTSSGPGTSTEPKPKPTSSPKPAASPTPTTSPTPDPLTVEAPEVDAP